MKRMIGPCGLACPEPAKGTADLYRVWGQQTNAFNDLQTDCHCSDSPKFLTAAEINEVKLRS